MGLMMEELLSNILGIAEVLVFTWGICQVELTRDWRRWAAAGGLWGMEMVVVLGEWLGKMAVVPVRMLGEMVIAAILMVQAKILHKMVKYWFSLFYAEIAFHPIHFALTFLNEYTVKLPWIDFFAEDLTSVCNICIMVFAAMQIRKRRQWVSWIQSMPIKHYMLGLCCGFCANGLKSYMEWEIAELDMKNKLFWGILTNILYLSLYLLGIGFAFINLLKTQYYRESSLKSEYLRMAQEHYKDLAGHVREVRSIRHDILVHVNVVEYLIQDGKIQEAITYLHEMKENIDRKNNRKIDIGNELVNAVMENELKKADLDTCFSVEGCLTGQPAISDFDLCTIFSNLLSNAVEACKRISGMEHKTIQLEIKQMNENLLIEMKNPICEQFSVEHLGTYTSKKDSIRHGYGIYNIRKTVEKYEGNFKFQINDDSFCVQICFFVKI